MLIKIEADFRYILTSGQLLKKSEVSLNLSKNFEFLPKKKFQEISKNNSSSFKNFQFLYLSHFKY